MGNISRRDFLYFSASSLLLFPLQAYAVNLNKKHMTDECPDTILILKQAFRSEMTAHRHYLGYVKKALAENYSNIAYVFHAFSVSERVHADNYKRIISKFGKEIKNKSGPIHIADTKSNLITAAKKELEKIKTTYPNFLRKLEKEECEEAIINCMYSWKSHRQHEEKIREIKKYSGIFFGRVAKKIEGMDLDFHVCEICGSTIDEKPDSPCDICNRSLSHYKRVDRPG